MNDPKQAAEQVVKMFQELGAIYAERITADNQPELYAELFNRFVDSWKVSPKQAANMARIVINFAVIKLTGKPHYSKEDFREIVSLALCS